MKKTLFAALALVSMASCSNEDVLEVAQKEAIGFENAFVNNSTRSVVDPSYSSQKKVGKGMFTDFHVYGFVEGAALFTDNGTKVAKNIVNAELKSDWKYEVTQYWIAGANYDFHAVAPSTGWTKTSASADQLVLSYENTDGTSDVLYAQTSQMGKVSGNAAVALTFTHILSKVKFSFENAYNATNAKIKVQNIKITDAYKNGSVTLKNSSVEWGSQDNETTLDFGAATNNNENVAAAYAYQTTLESYNELLIIPSTNKNYTVTFDVVILVNDTEIKTYNHTATVTNFNPESGKSYDIKAVIDAKNIDPDHKQEPIEFTVTRIEEWISGTNPSNITTTTPAN